jgi:hypothetical protein
MQASCGERNALPEMEKARLPAGLSYVSIISMQAKMTGQLFRTNSPME